MSAAILVLAGAVAILGSIDPIVIANGMIALTQIIAMLGLFVVATGFSAEVVSAGIGMIFLAGAMLIFAAAVAAFGLIPIDNLVTGLSAFAITLGIVTLALVALPTTSLSSAASLVVVALAMLVMAEALKQYGNMKWDNIVNGLFAFSVTLALVVAALVGLSAVSATVLPGAVAMFILASAMLMLVPVIMTLSTLDLQTLGIALGAMAGALIILGVAGALMTPVIPSLLVMALAIGMIGVACVGAGLGTLLFAAGLGSLFGMLYLIGPLIPTITENFGKMLSSLIKVITDAIPAAVNMFLVLLLEIDKAMNEFIPVFVTSVLNILLAGLKALDDKMPELVRTGAEIAIHFLRGIRNRMGDVVIVGAEILISAIKGLESKLPELVSAAYKFVIAFIDAMALGVHQNMAPLMVAVTRLTWEIGTSLVEGLFGQQVVIWQALGDLAKGAIEFLNEAFGLSDKFGSLYSIGANAIAGFIQGIKDGISGVIGAVQNIGSSALIALKRTLNIKSPSKAFAEIGMYADQGFAEGVMKYAGLVDSATANLGNRAINGLSSVISNISDAISGNVDMNPTIRPVVDLTDITKGGLAIDKLLSSKTVNLSSSSGILSSISNGIGSQNGSSELASTVKSGTQTQSVSFTQNNYSPTALSRIEIYRQTRNQLKGLAGV
jgi:hypothetical protein